MNERWELMRERYFFYRHFDFSEGKKYFGRFHNKVCRFCGRGEFEVSFRNDAHIIPELLGNRGFISNYECDECNQQFADILENNLGNFLYFLRPLLQIPGKRGLPKYKKNGSKIYTEEGKLKLSTVIGKEIVSIDEEDKRLFIEAESEPYIPVAVYKCFYKIFLSLIGEEDLVDFKWALDWIGEKDLTNSSYFLKPAMLYFTLTPKHKFDRPSIAIFKRKPRYEYLVPYRQEIPFYVMILSTANLVFQLPVFNVSRINKYGIKTVYNRPLPIPQEFDYVNDGCKIEWKYLDLSSSKKTRDNISKIEMQFEDIVRL